MQHDRSDARVNRSVASKPQAGQAPTAITSSIRVVYLGLRISNFVDHIRAFAKPAAARTTVPHHQRSLQRSIADISAALFSRSNWPTPGSARWLLASGTRSVVMSPAFELLTCSGTPAHKALTQWCLQHHRARIHGARWGVENTHRSAGRGWSREQGGLLSWSCG